MSYIGLMEYMYWCEDMKLAPVLDVWAGLSFSETVRGEALKPYIEENMNELEFLLGDNTTKYGELRASYGRVEPFKVDMVEIGNEDNLSNGCSTYAERFTAIYDAIHAKYPKMRIIASTTDPKCLPKQLPAGAWSDIHHYESPSKFLTLFNEFDNTPRINDYGIFVGEFASTYLDGGDPKKKIPFSTVENSIAEAVYMIGLERNSDLVKMAAFAPLLQHYNLTQWTVSCDCSTKHASTKYFQHNYAS